MENRSKARFKRRTSHVPNVMLMSKIYCPFSLALDSAHVKFHVWTSPNLEQFGFHGQVIAYVFFFFCTKGCLIIFLVAGWQCSMHYFLLSYFVHCPSADFMLLIERFSIECRKTKTKVITLTNHRTRRQSN